MAMDGLVQYLVSRKWRDLLVFEGPLAGRCRRWPRRSRIRRRNSARASLRDQQFKPGTDPREREKNDPALLSAINRDYDVVFVADDAFDFARQVPYHTVRARPVVGSIDLEPVAWHWTWERNGAPQVNSRFQKLTGGRHMEGRGLGRLDRGQDGACRRRCARVRRISTSSASSSSATGTFDGDKGLAVSVRPWDHQVRQAILLAAPYPVVARAPVEGFLHKTNVLDTLGDDEPETPCHLNK